MKTLTIKDPVYRRAVAAVSNGAFTMGGLPATRETAEAVYRAALQEACGELPARTAIPLPNNAVLQPAVWEQEIATGGGHRVRIFLPLAPERSRWPRVEVDFPRMENGLRSTGNAPITERAFSSGLVKRLRRWSSMFAEGRRWGGYTIRDLRDRSARREEPLQAGGALQRARGMALTPAAFKYDRAVGVEFETYGSATEQQIVAGLPVWARRKHDGSIRADEGYGHEIAGLLVRREMEPRLWRLCQSMQKLGLRVNRSCGFHVHLDQRGETEAAVIKRATVMNAWLEALQEIVPASRRSNDYCRWGISRSCRYRAVNVTAFTKYQTLEVRLHSGTVDYTKAIAWIRLLEMLAALTKKPRASTGCIATLEQLPLPAHDLAYWRARHAALNPHLYGQNNAAEQE